MEKVKFTENSKMVLETLVNKCAGVAFAREVLGQIEGKTFNGVNATLAALASKGYVTKAKEVYGEKFLTQYSVTEAGMKMLEPTEEVGTE